MEAMPAYAVFLLGVVSGFFLAAVLLALQMPELPRNDREHR